MCNRKRYQEQLSIHLPISLAVYDIRQNLHILFGKLKMVIKVTLQSREVENFWPLFFGHVFITCTSIWLHHQKIGKFYLWKLNLQVVSNCR